MRKPKFIIEYEPGFNNKYRIYRKLGWFGGYKPISSYGTLTEALADLQKLKEFPKYFEGTSNE